jgi:hypothetical protein
VSSLVLGRKKGLRLKTQLMSSEMSKMSKCLKVKVVKNFVFFIHTPHKGIKGSEKNFHDETKTGTLWKIDNKN